MVYSTELLGIREKLMICSKLKIDYLLMDYVFSDETENYVSPSEPLKGEPIQFRLRTGRRNVDNAFLHIGGIKNNMRHERDEGLFSYYSITFSGVSKAAAYYFSVEKNGSEYFYNKKGMNQSIDEAYNFKIIPDFKTPGWAKGAVMYQIYVDRFYNGDKSNDVVDNEYAYLSTASRNVAIWNKGVAREDICNFYGGDIQGIMDKLDYLKELGIEVILLNPIFVSPSNHKYDIQDYDHVDPHFGVITEDGGEALSLDKFNNRFASKYIKRTTDKTNLDKSNELLASFISLAHKNGIKVILDGVFNHCGSFNKWMDKEGFYNKARYENGAYFDEKSSYHDYFKWYDRDWPNNDAYDCWWGHLNHPKLNFEGSQQLYDKIMDIGRKWVSAPYNADGWRLDVAADLGATREFNHKFWKDFKKNVKEANPDAIILAEHYGDPSEWLQGDEWDTVMNYDAFMEPITWFLTGMEKHSDDYKGDKLSNAMDFEQNMRYNMAKFSIQSMMTAMNQLSNHDHSRFLTRTNKTVGRLHTAGAEAAEAGINKAVLYEAVVFQLTWPGSPSIYYGDEAGLCGWTDPDNRRTYPWGREDEVLIRFHKDIINIRKQYSCFRNGSLEYLHNEYGVLSFGRWNGSNKAAIAMNNKSEDITIQIPVWKVGGECGSTFNRVMYTFNGSYDNKIKPYTVLNGVIEIKLKAYSSAVFINETVMGE